MRTFKIPLIIHSVLEFALNVAIYLVVGFEWYVVVALSLIAVNISRKEKVIE